ncbi:MAG: hypothetical protein HXS44_15150 [Theionarchaea archaeon]|nr:hypothetical protein [Theionarchaea archaeon]
MNGEEQKVLEISLKDITTDGEKVVIDSPKLAKILQAERGRSCRLREEEGTSRGRLSHSHP